MDIDAIMNWVSQTPQSEKNASTTTTLTYPIDDMDISDEDPIQYKEVTETKTVLNDTMNNIRYDMVKSLILTLVDDSENLGSSLSYGKQLVFNTLLNKELIKAVDE